jgi:hypothetical protein
MAASGSFLASGLLLVRICVVTVRFTRGGSLVPWLGPALRGAVASWLKQQVCRHNPAEQQGRWKYCHGCEYLWTCPYGQTFEFEAAPPGNVSVRVASRESAAGPNQGAQPRASQPDVGGVGPAAGPDAQVRPVVLAPEFPIAARVARQDICRVKLLLLGPAAQQASQVIEALAMAGGPPGLGPEHVTYELAGPPAISDALWHPDSLPAAAEAAAGIVPRLTIQLQSPLFLRAWQGNRRRKLQSPTLADLVRPAVRTACELWAALAGPLVVDRAGLERAAGASGCIGQGFTPFQQRKWSNRTQQRFLLEGITGWATYADVPLALLPWLAWAGRIHIGSHRVAGAGGFRLLLD